jgi:hypothetical protein
MAEIADRKSKAALRSALLGDQSMLLNDRKPLAVIVRPPLFQRVAHFMECNHCKHRHPLCSMGTSHFGHGRWASDGGDVW